MRKFILTLTAIILCAIWPGFGFGQGCSDAGFCTINSIKSNSEEGNESLNTLKLGAFYGNADHAITVYGNYLEYKHQVNKKFGIDARLTSLAQHGNGISAFGLSDFFVHSNVQLNENLKLTLGVKIPLSKSNKSASNLPLPMDYQSSLGTLDFIFGIGYEIRKIQFVAAIQQPLTQNENQFISSTYPTGSRIRLIQSTNKFERSGDVLIRISYPIKITSKLIFTPSILPIYHLQNDKYTDEFDVKKEINGSKGLTMNGNAFIDYAFNRNNSIQLNVAMPFIVRDARPDGLTRSFIANIEYNIRF